MGREATLRSDGAKDLDVWMAQRAQPGGRFDAPRRVTSLRSPDVDRPGWLSPDNCRCEEWLTQRSNHDPQVRICRDTGGTWGDGSCDRTPACFCCVESRWEDNPAVRCE